jgi:Tfp pilus assembly protein PilO
VEGRAIVSRYLGYSAGIGAKLDILSVSGIGLAMFAAALFVSAVLPAQDEVERLRARVVAARSAPADQSAESEATARGKSQLAMFTRNFPTLSEAPGWVLRIHQIAARNELALETGEYRLTNGKDGGLARYQISLPLRGGYAQVRTFLEQVLTQIPAAALEEVTIKRDSVGAPATETRVRLTLYLADGQ